MKLFLIALVPSAVLGFFAYLLLVAIGMDDPLACIFAGGVIGCSLDVCLNGRNA